jgi:hypothetical protein
MITAKDANDIAFGEAIFYIKKNIMPKIKAAAKENKLRIMYDLNDGLNSELCNRITDYLRLNNYRSVWFTSCHIFFSTIIYEIQCLIYQ